MQVTLYTKPDCSLCEQLKADLGWLAQEIEFTVDERDIETDRELMARFRHLVPVLAVARAVSDDGDGELYLYPPHDLMRLRQTLLALARPEITRPKSA
jgi:hypothetical protein